MVLTYTSPLEATAISPCMFPIWERPSGSLYQSGTGLYSTAAAWATRAANASEWRRNERIWGFRVMELEGRNKSEAESGRRNLEGESADRYRESRQPAQAG